MNDWKLEPARDLGLPLKERAQSVRREDGLMETLLHAAWWQIIRAYLQLFHRLEIVGREHVPVAAPFVLVANHASHLDALVLAAVLGAKVRHHAFPIAAGDTFFQTPATAAFAAFVLHALPLWRKHCGPHALHELRDRLVSQPCIYILFPEGTRTRDGQMGRFRPGVGMIIAGTKVPVVPCHLSGCSEAWPVSSRFPRPRKIRVQIGEPLLFETTPDERAGWEIIGQNLEQRVRALAP